MTDTCTRCEREPEFGLEKGLCLPCYDYIQEFGKDENAGEPNQS